MLDVREESETVELEIGLEAPANNVSQIVDEVDRFPNQNLPLFPVQRVRQRGMEAALALANVWNCADCA